METFSYQIEIADVDLAQTHSIEALVNSGVFFTIAPSPLLRRLGIEPIGARRFRMTDGTLRELDIGHARVRIDGRYDYTIVAFGDETGPVLLGEYTLIGLALAADPERQRFVSLEPLPL